MTPFLGGRRLMFGSLACGVLFTALSALGIWLNPRLGWSSVLLSFTYWTGLAMASLILVATFRAAAAKWTTVLRRQMEQHASAIIPCALAFIPLAFGLRHLYPWISNPRRVEWLNPGGFIVRGALYLVIFIVFWFFLARVSFQRARGLAAAALPFLAYAMSFGAIDWLMSLEPTWLSTIFPAYYFAGAFVAAIALLLLTMLLPTDPALPSMHVTREHTANLAALLFAFSCFWAYIGFSQYMLIWHANLPDEATWLLARGLFNLARFAGMSPPASAEQFSSVGAAWFPLTALLMIGRFGLPFLTLLSFKLKRNATFLTTMCLWTLVMEWVDLVWMIKPALRLFSVELGSPAATLTWTDLTASLALGGFCVAFVVWRMRGVNAIPVNDPTLEYSLHYHQPMA